MKGHDAQNVVPLKPRIKRSCTCRAGGGGDSQHENSVNLSIQIIFRSPANVSPFTTVVMSVVSGKKSIVLQLGDRIDKVSWFAGTEDASIVRSIESVFGLAAGTRFLLRDEDGTRACVCACFHCVCMCVFVSMCECKSH
jgi:hypothetical protein